MTTSNESELPHDAELERAVLGAILQAPERLHEVDFLDDESFYDDYHRAVFGAMRSLSRRGEPVDLITVPAELGNPKFRETVADLAAAAPGSENIVAYARGLVRYGTVRALIAAGTRISGIGAGADPSNERSISVALADAESAIVSIRTDDSGPSRGDLLNADLDVGSGYLPTGFQNIDAMIQGFAPGRLYLVAARPAIGKSTLGLDFARSFCSMNVGVGFFSIEMGRDELYKRAILAEARVPSWQIEKHLLHDESFVRLVRAVDLVNRYPLYIDDSGTLSIEEMVSRSKRLHRSFGIGAVIVDYIQKMSVQSTHESRVRELGIITGHLKALAKSLHIPVIALSQLNRFDGDEPTLMNLRDSGELEQDADVVMMLWREWQSEKDQVNQEEKFTSAKIAKNRDGRVGHFGLRLIGPEHRFEPVGNS